MTQTQAVSTPHQLKVSGLYCRRGERTLFENLSFTANPHDCLHVTGANGSGKTSLLRLICGISRISDGSLNWNDEDISQNTGFFADLAYIGHKDGLKNELTAVENLEFYQSLETAPDSARIDQVLKQMGILQCADLATFQLSFGQRRRLAFARLLLSEYPLWVLDEPFTGIDQAGRSLIETLCVNHLTSNGLIILTNHQSLQDSPVAAYLKEVAL